MQTRLISGRKQISVPFTFNFVVSYKPKSTSFKAVCDSSYTIILIKINRSFPVAYHSRRWTSLWDNFIRWTMQNERMITALSVLNSVIWRHLVECSSGAQAGTSLLDRSSNAEFFLYIMIVQVSCAYFMYRVTSVSHLHSIHEIGIMGNLYNNR